jgi:glycosyltransferase involved in cell wall biosynthesis
MSRRVLMAGRTRYSLPLSPALARKFDALSRRFELRVLATSDRRRSTGHDDRFTLTQPFLLRRLDGPLFYLRFPFRVAAALRRERPEVVLVQGAQETALALVGRRLARSNARIILDLHGDPGAPTRLYGSPGRRALAPFADRLARRAIRGADGVRTLSPFTSELVRAVGVEPAAQYPAFMDLDTFTDTPPASLPTTPTLLFVGVLERYKAVDVIVEAWRLAASRAPEARLHIVGKGSLQRLVEELEIAYAGRVTWTPQLTTPEVARAMDEASALILASRSEGLPRIAVEALCRGRGVIGTRAGGIPDAVVDGENGVLVPVERADALADAMVRVATEPGLAAALGEGARRSAEQWLASPDEYASRTSELVERVLGTSS